MRGSRINNDEKEVFEIFDKKEQIVYSINKMIQISKDYLMLTK